MEYNRYKASCLVGVLTLCLVFGILSGGLAQTRDFAWYDSTTFAQYQAKQWEPLLQSGREALRRGFDYYYLRARLGEANFRTERYRLAAAQYQKALAFNSSDPYSREMLYYSLLYGGQPQAARAASREITGVPQSPVRFLGVLATHGLKAGPDSNPIGSMNFNHAGLNHSLGRRITLSHQYQFLRQVIYEDQVSYLPDSGHGPGPGGSANDSTAVIRRVEHTIRQQEYYLRGGFQFDGGWQLGIGFHPVWGEDTAGRFSDQALALSLRKDWPRVALTAHTALTHLPSDVNYQYGVGVTYYPLANTRLYYTAGGTLKTIDHQSYQHWITQQLGLRIFPNTWLGGQYDFGQIQYFTESDAALFYNLDDRFRRRYGGSIQYWYGGRHLFYILYLREEKTHNATGAHYPQNTFLMGLQFNF